MRQSNFQILKTIQIFYRKIFYLLKSNHNQIIYSCYLINFFILNFSSQIKISLINNQIKTIFIKPKIRLYSVNSSQLKNFLRKSIFSLKRRICKLFQIIQIKIFRSSRTIFSHFQVSKPKSRFFYKISRCIRKIFIIWIKNNLFSWNLLYFWKFI